MYSVTISTTTTTHNTNTTTTTNNNKFNYVIHVYRKIIIGY
jgi:hypothetical protein